MDLEYENFNYPVRDITYETDPEIVSTEEDIIKDLEKLKDNEIYFIIRSFYDEKENFKKTESFDFEGLIKVCNKTKEVFKDINPLLHLMDFHNVFSYFKIKLEFLFKLMVKIELEIKNLMSDSILKKSVNLLVDCCLSYIQKFYDVLNDFIFLHKFFSKNNLFTKELFFECLSWENSLLEA